MHDDLERFFRHLVTSLAASHPQKLEEPLSLAEIRRAIPYRVHRRALKLESSEDYELMLIRLCAGEGGFARIEPEAAHAAFVAEAQSSHPDLTLIEQHESAVLIFNNLAFAPPDQRYAPPAAV